MAPSRRPLRGTRPRIGLGSDPQGLTPAGGRSLQRDANRPQSVCREATPWGGTAPLSGCLLGTRVPVAPSPASTAGLVALGKHFSGGGRRIPQRRRIPGARPRSRCDTGTTFSNCTLRHAGIRRYGSLQRTIAAELPTSIAGEHRAALVACLQGRKSARTEMVIRKHGATPQCVIPQCERDANGARYCAQGAISTRLARAGAGAQS
jgi:hypothetical protein